MEEPSPSAPWYSQVWFVLVMLFLVLGPLGIPLLWKSPAFSKRAKIILTVVVTLYFIGVVFFGYWLLKLWIGFLMRELGL